MCWLYYNLSISLFLFSFFHSLFRNLEFSSLQLNLSLRVFLFFPDMSVITTGGYVSRQTFCLFFFKLLSTISLVYFLPPFCVSNSRLDPFHGVIIILFFLNLYHSCRFRGFFLCFSKKKFAFFLSTSSDFSTIGIWL